MADFEVTAPDGRRFVVTAPEGATQEDALRYAQQNMPAAPAPAAAPAAPNGPVDRLLTGAGDPFRGIEQLAVRAGGLAPGGALERLLRSNPNIAANMDAAEAVVPRPTPANVDARIQQREQQYQAGRTAAGDTGTDWWRMGGQVAATLPMAAAMPAGSSLLGATAAGATQGALLAGTQPVTDPNANFADEKKQQMELGGVLGAVTGPLGYALGRAISPRVSPDVRRLADEGVQMTPGQMAGGAARRVEDIAASVPFVGETVRSARRASIESLNRATANRVLRPIAATVPDDVPAGRELIEFVGQRISAAYDDAIARANPFAPDTRFVQDVAAVSQQFLTPASRTQFGQIVSDRVMSRLQGGQIDAATYQTIRSDLGRFARTYGASQDVAQREMADAFRGLQSAFDDLLARANPHIARELRAANTAYTGFVRLSDAAGRQGAVDGVFSPAQLSAAVRAGDNSARRGAFARGDAPLQDLSDAARNVLPQTVPDSGTPERMAMMGLASGGASALGLVSPGQLAAGAALYGAYTPPMQRAIQAAIMAPRGPALRATGEAIAQSGGAVTVPLGGLMLSPPAPQRPQERR